jgi:hypothetical protein
MNRSLLIAALLLAGCSALRAQSTVGMIDSVFVHCEKPASVEKPLYRVFGLGYEYTDSIDYRLPNGRREQEIPAFPPASFYALFDAQNITPPAWIDRDIRAIPDSVTSGGVTKFFLRYVLNIQYGEGSQATLVMPRGLPRGVDSINFRDVIGGTGGFLFDETITKNGADSVTAPPNLEVIAMIVYYDMTDLTSGIRDVIADRAEPSLRLVPNPARGSVIIDARLPAATRIVMSDLRGAVVREDLVAEATDRHTLALDGMARGTYFVRAIGADGTMVAESRLRIDE